MIVCHQHRYVFVQVPHTASTAVAVELTRHYGGESVLRKHSELGEYVSQHPEAANYFTFTTVRDPISDAYSMYRKLKFDHDRNYSDPELRVENGGWVSRATRERHLWIVESDASFSDYALRFLRRPYKSKWLFQPDGRPIAFDYIMRFDRIDEDLATVLTRLGFKRPHTLARINPTTGPSTLDYDALTPRTRRRLAFYAAGFADAFGLTFDPAIEQQTISRTAGRAAYAARNWTVSHLPRTWRRAR